MFHFLLGATSAYFQGQTLLLVSGSVATFCHLTLFFHLKNPGSQAAYYNHRNPNFGWFQVHQTYGFQWSLTYTPGNEQLLNLKMPPNGKAETLTHTPPVVGGGTSRLVDSGMYRGVNVFPLQRWTRNWIPSNSLVNRTWLRQTPSSATDQGVKGWVLGWVLGWEMERKNGMGKVIMKIYEPKQCVDYEGIIQNCHFCLLWFPQ